MSVELGDFRVELVDANWSRLAEVERLIYDVLYRDFGVGFEDEWRESPDAEAILAVALLRDEVVGTVRLLGEQGESEWRLRQLAVSGELQSRGLGRALMMAVEQQALASGASAIWLNARATAFPFYERLGYEYTGPEFISELTRIPHRPMRKRLA